MGTKIACIPVDAEGNKLWLKEPAIKSGKTFIKYKSTHNDVPFTETEIYTTDNEKNFVITGDDGTVIYRFPVRWVETLFD